MLSKSEEIVAFSETVYNARKSILSHNAIWYVYVSIIYSPFPAILRCAQGWKKIYFYKNKSQSNSVKRATSNLLTLHPLRTKYFCEIFSADFFSVAGKSFAFVSILITHFSLLTFWTFNVAITLRPIYVKERTMNGGGSMYVPATETRWWQNVNL